MKRRIALVLAALLALSTLTFGIALAESEKTMEDFLGTWKVEKYFLLDEETGDLLGEYDPDQIGAENMRVVIEPDRVVLAGVGSADILTDPSVQKHENGNYYLSAYLGTQMWLFGIDDSNSYFDHTSLFMISDNAQLNFQRTDEVVEIPEASGDEAIDLYYTPGEDLLLVDQDGIKVWLKGQKGKEYGTYEEVWDCYYWYTLKIENDTDTDIKMNWQQSVDGHDFPGTYSTNYKAHSTSVNIQTFSSYEFGSDDAMMSALNNPQTWALNLSFDSAADFDENTYEYKTITPLFTAQPVIIHFTGTSEDGDSESTDNADASAEETANPGEVHKDKETVKAVQQALNDAGYDCGTPDGVAGKKTKNAITAYQTDKGLTVTGTVTDETLAALGLA